MALPILDGNQTSTTLATTVSGGAHYPNHIIASAVTVGSLPEGIAFGEQIAEGYDNYGGAPVQVVASVTLPVSGTVTISNSAITISNSGFIAKLNDGDGTKISSTYVGILGCINSAVLNSVTIGSCVTHGVTIVNNSVTITGSVGILGTSAVTFSAVTGSVGILGTPSVTFGAIAGTVTANNPNGTLTTRFGSVTTANTVVASTAVTNTNRKYLLIQNNQTGTSAGVATIGIGFTPTTTQGIQLTAGASYVADSFVPTGAVYWLGAVTGANFTIVEG